MTPTTHILLHAGTVLEEGDLDRDMEPIYPIWFGFTVESGNGFATFFRPITRLPDWAQPAWREMDKKVATVETECTEWRCSAKLYHSELRDLAAGKKVETQLGFYVEQRINEIIADRDRLRTALATLRNRLEYDLSSDEVDGHVQTEMEELLELCDQALKGGDAQCEATTNVSALIAPSATSDAPSTGPKPASTAPTFVPSEGGATPEQSLESDTLGFDMLELDLEESKPTPTQRVEDLLETAVCASGRKSLWLSASQARSLARELETVIAEREKLRKDKERLDWLLEFITQHGGNGIAELPWTVVDPEELMEDRMEVVFDRATIDAHRAASKPAEQ